MPRRKNNAGQPNRVAQMNRRAKRQSMKAEFRVRSSFADGQGISNLKFKTKEEA